MTDPLSPAAARDRLSNEMARRWDAVNAVLGDLDEVLAATRPDLADPRDHSARCWEWHTGCLAARIRRTLTGDTDA